MVVMEQEKVERCLDDLFVRLEASSDEETRKEITNEIGDVTGYYTKRYNINLKKYAEIGTEILKEIEKRER